ncbi:hypothetical protein HY991_01740 [Candidatus Micrarchaeota archaeon]|nr:hypothetical protein [Candidatus Micrarchaeota archaeon]
MLPQLVFAQCIFATIPVLSVLCPKVAAISFESENATALPDLAVAYYKLSNQNPREGETIVLVVAVKNQGNADAGAFDVKVSWSDGVESVVPVGGLAAGGQTNVEMKKGFTRVGSFDFKILVDASSAISESSEGNNDAGGSVSVSAAVTTTSPVSPAPALPDLAVAYFGLSPVNPTVGEAFTLLVVVKNEGNVDAGVFDVRVSWSDGVEAVEKAVGVPAGQKTTIAFKRTFSKAGSFDCKTLVDSANSVLESNEGNNAGFCSVIVTSVPASPSPNPSPLALPDLSVAKFDFSNWKPKEGETVSLSINVINTGNSDAGAFDVKVSWSDGVEFIENIGGLPAHGSKSTMTKRTFTAPGYYKFMISVDSSNTVAESREGDNLAGGSIQVVSASQACPAKLDAAFNQQVFHTGDKVTVTVKVFDAQGNLLPSIMFVSEVKVNDVPYGGRATFYTPSDGVFTSTGVVAYSIPNGTYVNKFYTEVPGCDSVADYETVQVISEGTPTPTSTPIPISSPIPVKEPCGCADVYAPVCGVDRKTYASSCRARCVGVQIAFEGECRKECPFDCCENDPNYLDRLCPQFVCTSCSPASQGCVASCKRLNCIEHKCEAPQPTPTPKFCSYPNQCLTKKEAAERNCKPVAEICPQPVCAAGPVPIVATPTPFSYKKAYWGCYDGTSAEMGGETSCKPVEVWKNYAEEYCKGKCSEGKCGVSSFGVSFECGQGVSGTVSVTGVSEPAVSASGGGGQGVSVTGGVTRGIIGWIVAPTTPAEVKEVVKPSCIAEPRHCYFCPPEPVSCEEKCREKCGLNYKCAAETVKQVGETIAEAQAAIAKKESMSRKAQWTCQDGSTQEQGGETSCKSGNVWHQYAEEYCKGKCSEGKCGVRSFGVSIECTPEVAQAVTRIGDEVKAKCLPSQEQLDCFKKCIQQNCLPPMPPSEEKSAPLHFKKGWNLFTAPLADRNNPTLIGRVVNGEEAIKACGVTSVPAVFYYDPLQKNYVKLEGTPEVGAGYWIRLPRECTLKVTGVDFNVDGRKLEAGWNSIGGPSNEVSFEEIKGNCQPVSGPWEYLPEARKYQKTNQLKPGNGYLVKLAYACQLAQYLESEVPPALPEETGITGSVVGRIG